MYFNILILFITTTLSVDSFSNEISLSNIKHFTVKINQQTELKVNTKSTNLIGNKCQVRSLERYSKIKVIKKNSKYTSVLMNYYPNGKTWVLIIKSMRSGPKYLTIYCFNVPLEFTDQDLSNDFNNIITIKKSSSEKSWDWIESFSSILSYRPYLKLSDNKYKINGSKNVVNISTKRNNRSVIKYHSNYYPFSSVDNPIQKKCDITSLFHSNNNKNYKEVGEYKIVNLDYVAEKKYLLIIGRNFFKRPMYSVIHCYNVKKTFTVDELIDELDNSIELYKINKLHW